MKASSLLPPFPRSLPSSSLPRFPCRPASTFLVITALAVTDLVITVGQDPCAGRLHPLLKVRREGRPDRCREAGHLDRCRGTGVAAIDGAGFTRMGEMESHRPDGTTRRSLYWEMTRDQWADLRSRYENGGGP